MSRRWRRNEAKRLRTDDDRMRVEAAITAALLEDHGLGSHATPSPNCPACRAPVLAGLAESERNGLDSFRRFR